MGNRWLDLRRSDDGQSLVEAAIVVPFMLLMVIGIIDIGSYAYTGIEVASGARAGALYGSHDPATEYNRDQMDAHALANSPDVKPTPSATATAFCVCADGTASTCASGDCSSSHRLDYVQVTESVQVSPLIPFPGIPNPLPTITRVAIQQVSP